jgi:hypothetical protein
MVKKYRKSRSKVSRKKKSRSKVSRKKKKRSKVSRKRRSRSKVSRKRRSRSKVSRNKTKKIYNGCGGVASPHTGPEPGRPWLGPLIRRLFGSTARDAAGERDDLGNGLNAGLARQEASRRKHDRRYPDQTPRPRLTQEELEKIIKKSHNDEGMVVGSVVK